MLGITTNSGVNWDFTPFYLDNNEGSATGVIFTDANTGYVSSAVWDGRGAVSKTTNSGTDWVTTFSLNTLWDIEFPVSGASLVGYAVGDLGTIIKTHDAGQTWQSQQSGTLQSLNKVYFLDLDFGFAVADSGIILKTTNGGIPVELISFTANVNEKSVMLNWITATEINNYGFEVERSSDKTDWRLIGFKEGNGTTTEEQNYFYVDDLYSSSSNIFYYRLKQIDYDGTYQYSNIIEAIISPIEFSLSQNYPNPFNPNTVIKLSLPDEVMVNLSVFNIIGEKVRELKNEIMKSGVYEVEFDAPNLPSGLYLYKIEAGEFIQAKKMLLIK
jgi:hypothetical protein